MVNDMRERSQGLQEPLKEPSSRETVRDRFVKLLDVKSLLTIILTGVFGYLACKGTLDDSVQFLTVYTVVISFYFGTQHSKSRLN